MFKEFSRCSRKGFILSVLVGGVSILVSAGLMVSTGNPMFLKVGLIVGLVGARLAEAAFSHNCPLSKAGVEGAVLALLGIILVTADDFLTGLLA